MRMSEDGARCAIVVDGIVRTHRDTLEVALEAASVLKASGAMRSANLRRSLALNRVVDGLTVLYPHNEDLDILFV